MYNNADHNVLSDRIEEKFQNFQKPKFHIENVQPKIAAERPEMMQRYRSKMIEVQMAQATDLNNVEKGTSIAKRHKTPQELLYIIDTSMRFQGIIIELGESINNATRLMLTFIFLHAELSMVFNAYNMVLFFLRLANNLDEQHLGITMTIIYYGYNIYCSASDVLFTICVFSMVYNKIEDTSRVISKFSLYVDNDILRGRLLQFGALTANNLRKYTHYGFYNLDGSLVLAIVSSITTYIIILVQYGIKDSDRAEKTQ